MLKKEKEIEKCKELKQEHKQNVTDIQTIKQSIETIMNNHLYHIEKDMDKQTKKIEKLDNRIWWVLGILVVSTVIGMIEHGL